MDEEQQGVLSRTIPKDLRDELLRNASCKYCGSDRKLHIDHIIPYAYGGNNSRGNLQILCESCNYKKSGELPDNFPIEAKKALKEMRKRELKLKSKTQVDQLTEQIQRNEELISFLNERCEWYRSYIDEKSDSYSALLNNYMELFNLYIKAVS